MTGLSRYFKILIVIFLFILVCRIFYLDFSVRNSISFDDIVAVVLFIFGLGLVFANSRKGQFIVLAIIFVSLIRLINGNIILSKSNYITSSSSLGVGPISINGVGLLFLLIYCLINWSGLKNGFIWLRHGSESERKADEEKMVAFYYEKLNNSTPTEFNDALNMFESYPREAQIALNKIKSERGL